MTKPQPQTPSEPEIVQGPLPIGSRVADTLERRPYLAIAAAVMGSIDQFLQPFDSGVGATYGLGSVRREDFFSRFFHQANSFTDECCHKLVKIIHAFSVVPAVRDAQASALAKRIRDIAFQPSDQILAAYLGGAKKIEIIYGNIKKIRDELERAGTPDTPAATQVQPENVNSGPEPAASQTWATHDELIRQHDNLHKAQTQAFAHIVQYLTALNQLPQRLLSYACDKCFAGEVNAAFEQEQAAAVLAELQPKLRIALDTVGRASANAREDVEQERKGVQSRIEMGMTDAMLSKFWEDKIEEQQKAHDKWKSIGRIALVCLVIVIGLCFWIALIERSIGAR
jgi:hypothetical protein